MDELEALSSKKRHAKLDAVRAACRAYITGPLREVLADRVADITDGEGRVEVDPADPDGQTLPYVAEDVPNLDLTITDVTTIEPARTFWDKVVIAHGLRRWYERRGTLRQEGQRISRHYYDLHCLVHSDVGQAATTNRVLGADCVRHARIFFDRPDYDLASAQPGSFALVPMAGMSDALQRDYDQMSAMIFGIAPAFADVMDSIRKLEATVNA